MNGDSVFARRDGIVARRIAGETILVPVTRRAQDMGLFTLNEVGTFVWERLDGQRSLGEIATELAESFEVDAGRAQADLLAFATQLDAAACTRSVREEEADR